MEQTYLGRIVAVGITPERRCAALYRVSSRSFPNRMARVANDGKSVSIIPKPGHESDIYKNPYIAYNCARLVAGMAVLANGSHTDPIAEKIEMGMPVRDAIALTLLAMDFEKDDYATPRIVAVADPSHEVGWLGIVRHNGLDVRTFHLAPGQMSHLSTYGDNVPDYDRIYEFTANTPEEACQFAIDGGEFARFSNPVTAVAAIAGDESFRIAALDVER